MFIRLVPICSKTKRVLDCELVSEDGLENRNKISCQLIAVIVVSVYRRNNRVKRATRFMNPRKAVKDTRVASLMNFSLFSLSR